MKYLLLALLAISAFGLRHFTHQDDLVPGWFMDSCMSEEGADAVTCEDNWWLMFDCSENPIPGGFNDACMDEGMAAVDCCFGWNFLVGCAAGYGEAEMDLAEKECMSTLAFIACNEFGYEDACHHEDEDDEGVPFWFMDECAMHEVDAVTCEDTFYAMWECPAESNMLIDSCVEDEMADKDTCCFLANYEGACRDLTGEGDMCTFEMAMKACEVFEIEEACMGVIEMAEDMEAEMPPAGIEHLDDVATAAATDHPIDEAPPAPVAAPAFAKLWSKK